MRNEAAQPLLEGNVLHIILHPVVHTAHFFLLRFGPHHQRIDAVLQGGAGLPVDAAHEVGVHRVQLRHAGQELALLPAHEGFFHEKHDVRQVVAGLGAVVFAGRAGQVVGRPAVHYRAAFFFPGVVDGRVFGVKRLVADAHAFGGRDSELGMAHGHVGTHEKRHHEAGVDMLHRVIGDGAGARRDGRKGKRGGTGIVKEHPGLHLELILKIGHFHRPELLPVGHHGAGFQLLQAVEVRAEHPVVGVHGRLVVEVQHVGVVPGLHLHRVVANFDGQVLAHFQVHGFFVGILLFHLGHQLAGNLRTGHESEQQQNR